MWGAQRASKPAEWKQVAARWARPGWVDGGGRKRKKERKKHLKIKSFSSSSVPICEFSHTHSPSLRLIGWFFSPPSGLNALFLL